MPSEKSTFNIRSLYVYLKYKLRLPADKDNMQTTIEMVRSGATMSGANLWVLVVAIFTASLGLNVNSTAVIIGAMLISPLMGPIVAIGMGVAIHDFGLVYRALKNFGLAVGLSILTSTVYFLISPLKVPGSELLARTSPTIYDVLIAIFGGLAGIIAGSGKLRQSNVVPGVAIATALMPPLCTVGFGIANLNPTYMFGAFYLFFINTVFISLATYFIVRILRYPLLQVVQSRRAQRIKRMITAIVLITLIPSIFLTYGIVRRYIFEEKAKQFVQNEFTGNKRLVLKSTTQYITNLPVLTITVIGAEIDSVELAQLQGKMMNYGIGNARLEIQQGFENVTGKGSLIGSINASIENNNMAIGQIYAYLDSLRKNEPVKGIEDSLQAGIGREIRALMPALLSFSMKPVSIYNASADKIAKGWALDAKFKNRQNEAEIKKLKEWLKQRLPADTLVFSLDK
jgi:uncharacterized hydrophobic protein (TIGR00271 family)